MLEEDRDARMAALAVSALWGPEPATLLWLVQGGGVTPEVQGDLGCALQSVGGEIVAVYVNDPDAAKKFAVFAACRAARFYGKDDAGTYKNENTYQDADTYAAYAYGLSMCPHVQGSRVSQVRRMTFERQFKAAIRSRPQGG